AEDAIEKLNKAPASAANETKTEGEDNLQIVKTWNLPDENTEGYWLHYTALARMDKYMLPSSGSVCIRLEEGMDMPQAGKLQDMSICSRLNVNRALTEPEEPKDADEDDFLLSLVHDTRTYKSVTAVRAMNATTISHITRETRQLLGCSRDEFEDSPISEDDGGIGAWEPSQYEKSIGILRRWSKGSLARGKRLDLRDYNDFFLEHRGGSWRRRGIQPPSAWPDSMRRFIAPSSRHAEQTAYVSCSLLILAETKLDSCHPRPASFAKRLVPSYAGQKRGITSAKNASLMSLRQKYTIRSNSTVLAHVMKTLNERYQYGLELFLLSIDEGITGYRDDSLETVKRNQQQYNLPLKILSYHELYGWTMDAIVEKVGRKNNCTFCGVFRRQALDRGAAHLNVDHIVTGHNADDIAETISTQGEDTIRRSKPLKYAYEKEIVMYAYFKKLDYFSTECIYSPDAYRGHARAFLKNLEVARPSVIIDIIHSGEAFEVAQEVAIKPQRTCARCGYISSNELCKACHLLEGLERGIPMLGVRDGKKTKTERIEIEVTDTIRTIPKFELPQVMRDKEPNGALGTSVA
ncbi:6651_t:CDS:10, partial [Acaulospora colombiana]